ncbi:MAG: hypothetical protein JJU20_08085 [Opitutales bacterium]|nr:hypothetical protein [Opitutales bacterium]
MRTLWLLVLTLATAGCATTSQVMNPAANHPDRAVGFRNALQTGSEAQLTASLSQLTRLAGSQDRILFLKERGRLQSLVGDLDAGIKDFQEASDRFEEQRMRASLSVSQTFFSSVALATNDLAIPYDGAHYEKVMLHNLQALNYLRLGDYVRARIELNRADVEQEYAREQNRRLVDNARRQLSNEDISMDAVNRSLQRAEQRMASVSPTATSPFLNAFTYFLSGVLFEHFGEWDRALIDYRKALEIQPNHRLLRESVQQLNQRRSGQLGGLEGKGRVVVLYGDGFIANRSALQVPFVYDTSILQISLPYYDASQISRPVPLLLDAGRDISGQTSVVSDLNAMAVHELKARYPALLTRQVLRLIVKRKVQKAAEEESQFLGFLANIMNVVTDRPDLRSWSTLPGNLQIASLHLPPGSHELKFGTNRSLMQSVTFDLDANQTVFLIVDRMGNRLHATMAKPSSL